MVTPDGYLYSREAILENLLQQKKAIKRKLAAYEAQQAEEQQKVRGHQQRQHEFSQIAGTCAFPYHQRPRQQHQQQQ